MGVCKIEYRVSVWRGLSGEDSECRGLCEDEREKSERMEGLDWRGKCM